MNLIGAIVAVALGILLLGACAGTGESRLSMSNSAGGSTIPAPLPQTASVPDQGHSAARNSAQREVLDQIGAHHAYARGLAGRGVRIGIQDTIIDYTQTGEFGDRVKLRDADGAVLSYPRPLGDATFSDISRCRRASTCKVWRGDSQGDLEAYNRWVRHVVAEDGWPTSDDSVFLLDLNFDVPGTILEYLKWKEVPTPYGRPGHHGTAVASVAAGSSLGVAPEATIIPVAENLTTDQSEDQTALVDLSNFLVSLPASDRKQFDTEWANSVRNSFAKFDIINRSYGVQYSTAVFSAIKREVNWYSRYFPQTLNAELQIGILDADKTIVVYSAGNESDSVPGAGAILPYFLSPLRGHTLAVVATDPGTRIIASYSNRCGPLPSNWNAALHGRHYCLAAPGTVQALVPDQNNPGNGSVQQVNGTSCCRTSRIWRAGSSDGTLSRDAREHGDCQAGYRYCKPVRPVF